MKKISLAAAAACTISASAAFAADLPARTYTKASPVVAPVYNWAGFYIGGNVGGAWGDFDLKTSTAFTQAGYFDPANVPAINAAGIQSIKPSGFVGGIQGGYNWQAGSFLFGGELDFQSFHLSGSASTNAVYPSDAPDNFTITSSASTDWLFTARPRIGFVNGGWLLYATGGLAVTQLRGNFSFTDSYASPFTESASFSKTKAGYAVGAGIEAKLWQNWSLKAEYLYVNFGSESVSALGSHGPISSPFTHSVDLKANVVRVGVNYYFQ